MASSNPWLQRTPLRAPLSRKPLGSNMHIDRRSGWPVWFAASFALLVTGSAAVAHESYVLMQRIACFGECPIYTIRVSADGSVEFKGVQFVAAKGKRKSRIPKAEAAVLFRRLTEVGFFNLQESYVHKADGCGDTWTDLPSAVITVELDGRKKTVTHYHGCRNGRVTSDLERLTELESQIDRVASVKKWVSGSVAP